MNWVDFAGLMFGMGVGHAVVDCVLQDPGLFQMGKLKQVGSRWVDGSIHWPYWLLAHGLLNGWAVAIVTDSPILGIAETGAHVSIDLGKMRGVYGVHVDQAAHWACKVAWAYITIKGGV